MILEPVQYMNTQQLSCLLFFAADNLHLPLDYTVTWALTDTV